MSDRPQSELHRRPLFLREQDWIRSLTRMCVKANISPNAISILGLVVSLLAGAAFALTSVFPGGMRLLWLAGVVLLPVRVLANTLDGMVAVEWHRGSPTGILYNEGLDRLADVAIFIGAGYSQGADPVLGYLTACMALFIAYIRTLVSKAGAPADFRGPMAKGHRMVTLFLASTYCAIIPTSFQPSWGPQGSWGMMAIALTIIFVGGIITCVRRLRAAARGLQNQVTPK